MKLTTQDAYQLFHEGSQVFADIEQHGIHVDMDYCRKMERHIVRKINRLQEQIEDDEVVKEWRKVYRTDTNFNSGPQLAHILFERLGHTPTMFTLTKKKPATSLAALEGLKIPFTARHNKVKQLRTAKNTFLRNIMLETVDGVLHPFFHLNTVTTYRSSSAAINFQNLPKRDKYIQKLIRRAIKASPGHQILEIDFKGAEVCTAYCYNHDPTLFEYIVRPEKDMHRDSACECYLLPQEEVGSRIRYAGKSGWVFPQFYGNWYEPCAKSMWDCIDELGLVTESGVPLKKHLASKKIRTISQFENHLEGVEDKFWNEWFPIYNQWKDDWVKKYNRRGWMQTLTGFRCSGVLKRNKIINYPIQGSSFHCLLYALIEGNKELRKRRMKTRIMGQIHDSIVFDLCPKEKDDVLEMVKCILEEKLPAHWKWIIVPLSVEAELSPVDGTWFDMKEIEL